MESFEPWEKASEPEELERTPEQLACDSTPKPSSVTSPLLATPSPSRELPAAASAVVLMQGNPANSGRIRRATDSSAAVGPRHSSSDITAVSTQLLVFALEEENDRLRSALATERRTRQQAQVEAASHAARARDCEQRNREVCALLVDAQRRVAELEQEATSRVLVQAWLDSASAHCRGVDCHGMGDTAAGGGSEAQHCVRSTSAPAPTAVSGAAVAVATAAAATAAAHGNTGELNAACSTADVFGAACGLRTEDNGSLGTCLYTSGFERSSDVDSEALDQDSSARPLRERFGPRRSTDTGGGCAAAAATSTPPEELCYCHIKRRTDTGAGDAGPYEARTFDPSGPLQRAHTTGSGVGSFWGDLHHVQMRAQPLMLSPHASSRALATAFDTPNPFAAGVAASSRDRSTGGHNWASEPNQEAAAGALPSPLRSPHCQLRSTACSVDALAPQLSVGGFRAVSQQFHPAAPAQQLGGTSLHSLLASGNRGGAKVQPPGSTAFATATIDAEPVADFGGEWCNIPLGSPVRTPKKGARAAAVEPAATW